MEKKYKEELEIDNREMEKREGEMDDTRKRWEEYYKRKEMEIENLMEEVYSRYFTVNLVVG